MGFRVEGLGSRVWVWCLCGGARCLVEASRACSDLPKAKALKPPVRRTAGSHRSARVWVRVQELQQSCRRKGVIQYLPFSRLYRPINAHLLWVSGVLLAGPRTPWRRDFLNHKRPKNPSGPDACQNSSLVQVPSVLTRLDMGEVSPTKGFVRSGLGAWDGGGTGGRGSGVGERGW